MTDLSVFKNLSHVETDYMIIHEVEPKPKTKVWEVTSRHHGDLLGYVKWYAQWRQYVFWPEGIVLSKSCMEDLCRFLLAANVMHAYKRRS